MKVTSTEFRKNLFQLVERALQGEMVEITHKGQLLRLTPGNQPTKMSRLVHHDTLACSPEELERAQRELDDEMRNSWEDKWLHRSRTWTPTS